MLVKPATLQKHRISDRSWMVTVTCEHGETTGRVDFLDGAELGKAQEYAFLSIHGDTFPCVCTEIQRFALGVN